jgi:hypothetical protein
LQHGPLDARNERRRNAARRNLALLDQELLLALDGPHCGRAEPQHQHGDDQEQNLEGEARAQRAHLFATILSLRPLP